MNMSADANIHQPCNVTSMPYVYLLQSQIAEEVVNDLNNYLDDLREQEDLKVSAASRLVGQIRHGEQLNMDPKDSQVAHFVRVVETISAEYVNYFNTTLTHPRFKIPQKQVLLGDIWSVHSFAGDYNPLHDHGTDTEMGLSFVLWTKVPPQILDFDDNNISPDRDYEVGGESDGCIELIAGRTSQRDSSILKPPQSMRLRPRPGLLVMFPSWLQHTVYPFMGDGERRTVAGNVNCWPVNKENSWEMREGLHKILKETALNENSLEENSAG